MTKVFVFDSSKCNGCYGCQLACKDEHVDNEWPPYAKPQPDTGQFWCKMIQTDHGQVPKVKVEYKPVLCSHCDSCALIDHAPECVYRTDDGMVVIDPVKAKGRKDLLDLCGDCPIYWNEELEIPQKCTGCQQLIDEGQMPRCADICATGALRFGEYEEFADELENAETLVSKEQGPHVFYINMPHLFIGGEVWDPEIDEIIQGAEITLSGDAQCKTLTDEFGDFWFGKLDPGSYVVTIKAEGYEIEEVIVELEKSMNIGDFPLKRK